MASAILSSFPRPPTHIPTSPLPATPGSSRPPTPSGRKSADGSTNSRDKRRSRGSSFTARSDGVPRMSVESSIAFANADDLKSTTSPTETSFSHATVSRPSVPSTPNTMTEFGERRGGGSRVGHYENLRRSLHKDGDSNRGSHYRDSALSQGTVDSSGSSHGHLLTPQTPSAFSSRPNSFIGPGTPPLNVPLSASARLAALRAKRAGLNSLALSASSSPGEGPKTPTSNLSFNHLNSKRMSWGSIASSAGPPPNTPLPPIPSTPNSSAATSYGPSSFAPSVYSDGSKRKSITLNSPTQASYPFPSKFDMATPTSSTFHGHRSSPSGATFGHGMGPNFSSSMRGDASRAGDHSRGSSFGSDGGRGTSTVADFGEFRLGMNPNESVATFGGRGSDFSEDGSHPLPKKPRHISNFSTSTTTSVGTAAPLPAGMKRIDSWKAGRESFARESFQGGLAALSALTRGSDSPGSSSSDPSSRQQQPPFPQIRTPNSSLGSEDAPIDVHKELERLRREKQERRVSSASVMSNFSTRTGGTFRGAASRVMDVTALDVADDEMAEMAGERLLGSIGDGLEALAIGKRKGSRLGLGSASNSRPGSSAGPSRKVSGSGSNGQSPDIASQSQSPALGSSRVRSPSNPSNEDDDADLTITLPKAAALSPPGSNPNLNRDSLLSFYGVPNESLETFEAGVVGSGSTFTARLSAEIENRSSNGSSVGQHLMMKASGSKAPPKVMVVGTEGGKTPVSFSRALPSDREKDEGQERLVNITVWNDAPATPKTGDSNWSSSTSVDQQRYAEASANNQSASLAPSARPSMESTLTARLARSPSPSGTSFHSHSTIKPGQPGTSSAKPSIDLDRPDSAMSSGSRRHHFPQPPALSLSRATPLSSETELVLHDDEDDDDVLASPSAGRDRGKGVAGAGKHKARPSEDFANQLEMDMKKEGMHGEFALLQEVAIREKRLNMAMFGRGLHTISRPNTQRPQSMAAIPTKLPDSPSSSRGDGASSPEIEEMIRRGKRSLSKKRMRRRRSTGALHPYASGDWRRSDVSFDLSLPRRSDATSITPGNSRRAMELDRDGVRIRDSIVLELGDSQVEFPQSEDHGADSDSSIDIHTPLPRLMVQAGLLSPYSKVLRPPTPEADPRASYMPNGLKVPNDRRNTEKRKRRHRDGKLLREGVGLTTGLGWSDSEDEDAPSPLTRRLSSMTLSSSITRKASLASSINSFARSSMTSLNRSPSLPSIPAGAVLSSTSIASKHSSSSGSDSTSRRGRPKALTVIDRTPYAPPEMNRIKPALKPSSTMSIIEHAQMLPTATLYSKNTPFAGAVRRSPMDFNIPGTRRPSSPAGNSSQSSNGGVILPVTPDADLPPTLSHSTSSLLKDMSTPEDIQGVSGGSSVMISAASLAGTGLAGYGFGRGRSWTSPPSPTPAGAAILPDNEEPMPAKPRAAQVRYSGGNFSYPTSLSTSSATITPTTPETPAPAPPPKTPLSLRKPAPRGLQPLTLPVVVAAGGRLSPRAGGTFALPSSPSLAAQNNATTPKRTGLPLPGSALSKSTSQIPSNASAPPSAFGRARSGSQSSSAASPPVPPVPMPVMTPVKVNTRMPQPVAGRHRTLSGGGGVGVPVATPVSVPLPPIPQTPTASNTGSLRKSLGGLKSIVASRGILENAGAATPKSPGISRTTSAPGTPPTRIGGPSSGKTGTGMTYRKSAGSAAEALMTPMKSKLPPPSSSRLATPGFYANKNASSSSLTSSAVGVAI